MPIPKNIILQRRHLDLYILAVKLVDSKVEEMARKGEIKYGQRISVDIPEHLPAEIEKALKDAYSSAEWGIEIDSGRENSWVTLY